MKITFGKGLTDAMGAEVADGFVTSCSNARFRGGFAEAVGGISSVVATFTGPGSTSSLAQLYTSTNTYVTCSTSSALGVYTVGGSSVPTAITRKTEGKVISSATAAGTTVTITTSTAHGLFTADVISAWGFTPSTYNVESAAVTRISATIFTYVVPVAPAVTPATAFGLYSVDATTSHVAVDPGGELNGILILNSTTAGCYYWGGNTAIPLRKVVGSFAARASIPFGNFIVQLAPTVSSVEYPFRIAWSNAAEPGAVPNNGFTPAVTNQAGSVEHPEIGEMVWAAPLGDDLIIYGTKGRLLMRYVGGNNVFKFNKLPGDEGLYAARMVVDTPVGHVFVDRDRHVRVHSGGASRDISMGRVQNLLGTTGSFSASDTVIIGWVVSHARQSEVWIAYYIPSSTPAGGSASSALIWNWEEDTWGSAGLSNKNAAISVRSDTTSNLKLYAAGGSASSVMVTLDDNSVAAGALVLERTGIDAGNADVYKNLQRSRWYIDANPIGTDSFTVEHGAASFSDASPTYATGVTYTPGTTDYANARATGGRFLAVRLTLVPVSSYSSMPYYQVRVRSADLDFTLGGKR
jgi:hypothetical protein